jgi:hypothetical protein
MMPNGSRVTQAVVCVLNLAQDVGLMHEYHEAAPTCIRVMQRAKGRLTSRSPQRIAEHTPRREIRPAALD